MISLVNHHAAEKDLIGQKSKNQPLSMVNPESEHFSPTVPHPPPFSILDCTIISSYLLLNFEKKAQHETSFTNEK